jgi:Right handed beta helix region
VAALVLIGAYLLLPRGDGYVSGNGPAVSGGAAATPICGRPVLHSRYSYTIKAGSPATPFTSREHGLPSFGSPGTDFPHVTAGYIIPPGNDSRMSPQILDKANVIVYFAPGNHTQVPQIQPGDNEVFLGGYAPGPGEAKIDNGGKPGNTLASNASNVTIEYLTIANFDGTASADSFGGSIVDEYGGYHWTVDHDTVGPNGDFLGKPYTGYGIGVGSGSTYQYNCVIGNGEGGFNNGTNVASLHGSAPWGGPAYYKVEQNEITDNAIATCQVSWGCTPGAWGDPDGVAAGIKVFWSLNGTINHNYIHDNYGVGVWPDTNNSGLDISYNHISDNLSSAISYEASVNANITNNIISGNGWNPKGRTEWAGWPNGFQTSNGGGPAFADGAIYIDNSGGALNVRSGSSRYLGELNIAGNHLINNFGGIVAFADRNRFCGEGPDGGQGTCTINGIYSHHSQTGAPYYVQPTLYTGHATVNRGSAALAVAGGFQANYSDAPAMPGRGWVVRAYNADTGAVVPGVFPAGETIAGCAGKTSCTLAKPATATMQSGRFSGTPVEVETGAPGGCGMYDLMGSGTGKVTGSPPAPYFDNCNWWVRDVHVYGNSFFMNANPGIIWAPGQVTNCTASTGCGYVALYASTGPCTQGCFWSPYADGTSSRHIISSAADNFWKDNTYSWVGPGQWSFEAGATGNILTRSAWQGPAWHQDADSRFYRPG